MWNFRENLRDCASRYFGYHVPQRVAAMQRALLRRVLPRLSRSVCTKPDPPKSPPPPSALTIAASGLTSFAGIGAISALHFGIAPHDLTMVLGSMGASAVLLYGAPAARHLGVANARAITCDARRPASTVGPPAMAQSGLEEHQKSWSFRPNI